MTARSPHTFGLPVPYRWIWLIGLVFTVLFVVQGYVNYLYRQGENPFPWFFQISTTATHYATWVLLTPVLYRLSQLRADGPVISPPRVLIHCGLGLVFAILQAIASSALRAACYYFRDHEWMNIFDGHGMGSIIASIISGLVEYLVIVGGFVAIDTYKMYRAKQIELVRMENALNNAQLQALKMQLQPHFLFNTLHSIASLMNENIRTAQTMVSKLGFLLRTILDSEQKNKVSLREELSFVRSYLDIEEIRFADRLQITYRVADNTLDCLVPNLILQPLVENAIKHGFSTQRGSGHIQLESTLADDTLTLTVRDNGRRFSGPTPLGHGVGLRNVRTRIDQMYGDRATFQAAPLAQQGFQACISLPCETAGDA
jgi:hypothetical protein